MRFRPCIDIHNGKVKQIVGGSLRDSGDEARENYISNQGAEYFAQLYKEDGLKGGHVILLNPPSSDYFGATKRQALAALEAYPGGLQIGGGITAENAEEYLEAGASHVIVTSYVLLDGEVRLDRMEKLKNTVGRERAVIALCLEGPSTITRRKEMLSVKREELLSSIQELESCVDYIDWKQQFYDDVLSGKRPYVSNLIASK